MEQQFDNEATIRQKRAARIAEERARRRARRRRVLFVALGTFAALAVVVGGVLFVQSREKDPSVAAGIAAGKELTRAPTESTTAAMRREAAALRRKIRREKQRLKRERASAGGGSAPKNFSALERSVSGPIGVSYGPVGSDSQTTLGSWSSGVAWSTAKVPVAVALARQNGGSATSSMRSAITASDNGAAEAMWSALGSGSRAGAKVDRVLHSAGDSTNIQTQRVRSGFTPFGQTNWSIDAQQRFAAHLPCISGSNAVLSLMGNVVSDQRWGLGNVGSSPKFKGGWGPGSGGGYLVRQFGIVNVSGGQLAVAIAAEPSNGQFQSGIDDLNKIANWIDSNLKGSSPGC